MNKSLKILLFSNAIFIFGSNLIGPLLAIYIQGIDKSILAVSTAWSIFLGSTTLFTYLMSKWGDRVKEKEYLLVVGYLIRALVWMGYIFVDNIVSLFVLQFLLGIGEALGTPAFDAIFAEHLDKNRHIHDYSTWKVIENLLGAVSAIIGGYVANIYGFLPLFVFMSLFSLISMLGVLINHKKLV